MSIKRLCWISLGIAFYGLLILVLFPANALAVFAESKNPPTEGVRILADHQTYDEVSGKSHFTGNVNVSYQNYRITAPEATVDMSPEGKPDVAMFYKRPLVKRLSEGKSDPDLVQADTVQILLGKKEMLAQGNSVSNVTSMASNPVTIRADIQQFDNLHKTVLAKGSVIVDYEKARAFSPLAVMWMDDQGKAERVLFSGGTRILKDTSQLTGEKVTIQVASGNMTAEGNVKTRMDMTGDRVNIDSDFQQYDKTSDTMLASGNVKVVYGDYITHGPKASFKMKNKQVETIYLIGRSSIIADGKKVFADKIVITTEPRHFEAFGNVQTQFVSKNEPNGGPSAKTKSVTAKRVTPGKEKTNSNPPSSSLPVPSNEDDL